MADLSAASVDDVSAFFKTYYAPNNAVIAIVGDVDTKTALAKVEKYFGAIPAQPAPPEVDMTEPPQKEERRLTLEDALARLPRIDMAYKIPPGSSPDSDALSVLGTILSGGRSSRFYESIVRQKAAVERRGAGTDGSRGPGLFSVGGTALPGKTLTELETAIDQEIERVKSRADRRLGDGEGAQPALDGRSWPDSAAPSTAPCSCRKTRCSTTTPIGSTRAPT